MPARALSGALLVAVMLLTSVKVFFRYGLREGLLGVDQISGTLLVYIAFLGAAWVLRREEHVTIDLLVTRLGPATRRRLTCVNSVVGALICLVVAYFGTVEAVTFRGSGASSSRPRSRSPGSSTWA